MDNNEATTSNQSPEHSPQDSGDIFKFISQYRRVKFTTNDHTHYNHTMKELFKEYDFYNQFSNTVKDACIKAGTIVELDIIKDDDSDEITWIGPTIASVIAQAQKDGYLV